MLNVRQTKFYKTFPGTYWYVYVAYDGSVWSGNYEIYEDPGEPGGLFHNGEDGADGENLYFELRCFSIGATLFVWTAEDFENPPLYDSGPSFRPPKQLKDVNLGPFSLAEGKIMAFEVE